MQYVAVAYNCGHKKYKFVKSGCNQTADCKTRSKNDHFKKTPYRKISVINNSKIINKLLLKI